MMEWQKDHAVPRAAWEKLDDEARKGKFPIGVLFERTDGKEYTKAYDEIIERAQAAKKEETA